MSRSALWRQEGAKKQREQQAEELFQLAVEEGRVSSLTPCHGVLLCSFHECLIVSFGANLWGFFFSIL
jgi:hypothetical protein